LTAPRKNVNIDVRDIIDFEGISVSFLSSILATASNEISFSKSKISLTMVFEHSYPRNGMRV